MRAYRMDWDRIDECIDEEQEIYYEQPPIEPVRIEFCQDKHRDRKARRIEEGE